VIVGHGASIKATPAPLKDRPLPNQPPNLIFIICDDLAWGDLACHGNPHVATPHLDALHTQSTRLTRYGSGPVCTPARAAVMTGRYPHRTGAIDTYLGRSMMHADETTLAHVLRDAGYAPCLSGKWHLGDEYPMRPHDQGFDAALYHRGGGLRQPANLNYPDDSYFDPLLMHNGRATHTAGYCSDVYTDHATQFMAAHRDRPFFCYLAYNAPHSPFEVADDLAQPYLDAGLPEKTARLYAMVSNIDANVGRVMHQLDTLGLADDTLRPRPVRQRQRRRQAALQRRAPRYQGQRLRGRPARALPRALPEAHQRRHRPRPHRQPDRLAADARVAVWCAAAGRSRDRWHRPHAAAGRRV